MSFFNQATAGLPQGAFSSQQPATSVQGMKEKIPSGYRKYAVQNFTPEQIELFSQLFGHLGPDSPLAKLASGDQSMFQQMEEPALRQFSELQGNLASRFSGAGMGGRRSSGFQNASNAAASDFASQLQANRLNLQNQALNELMGFSQSLLGQRPYTQGLSEKRQKQSGGGFMDLLGEGLGAVGGFFSGGPSGAMRGASNTFSALSGF